MTAASEASLPTGLKIGANSDAAYRMSCMELWGGNTSVETSVALPGLAGWVHSKPVEPAVQGGDVYYLSVCSAGLLSRIVLADVAGHGQEVGGAAITLRDLLRQHVNAFDQSKLMRGINDSFGSGSDESVQYATAAVLGYYCETRQLIFANAGHPPVLWYRAAQQTWEWLHEETPHAETAVEDLPLGLIAGTKYTQTAVRLGPGDLVLIYTDGVTESVNDASEELGYSGLLTLARSLPVHAPAQVGPALLAALARFRGASQPFDDLSVIVLQECDRLLSD
ncbi:MAG TPA: PP2C family protein-serine/threonine phosphatase [Terriglobales bacterium]|nr:PP2C family protein-serine/threonine phosphatase [Terriglobales bacterium]